jgi:hypothetical protein
MFMPYCTLSTNPEGLSPFLRASCQKHHMALVYALRFFAQQQPYQLLVCAQNSHYVPEVPIAKAVFAQMQYHAKDTQCILLHERVRL